MKLQKKQLKTFWLMPVLFVILSWPVSTVFAGNAILTWSPPANQTNLAGYKVYYGTASGVYGTPIDVGNQTSYTVTGLANGTWYFAVTDYNTSSVQSGYSSEVSKTFTPTGPLISAISANSVTTSGATISWTTDIASTSQVEYGATTAYGSLTAVDSSLVTGHSVALSSLLSGTTYHYRVKSADGSGNLSVSSDYTFTTTPVTVTGPTISGVSSGNLTTVSALITWTTNISATSQVEYGTSTAYGFSTTLDTNLLTSHSQTLNGLQSGTLYHYRVRSADGSGNLSISTDHTFTTAPAIAIANVTAGSISSSGAVVTWSTNVPTTSQVEYGTTTAYGLSTALDPTLVTSHSQALSGLQAGTTYHFRVDSSDIFGDVVSSTDYTFTTSPAISSTPTGPVISNVVAGNINSSGATITWNTTISATSQVDYGTLSTYGFATAPDSNLVTAHSETLSGLQPGTLYHFRVESADGAGNLTLSTDYTFTTSGNANSNKPSSPKLHKK